MGEGERGGGRGGKMSPQHGQITRGNLNENEWAAILGGGEGRGEGGSGGSELGGGRGVVDLKNVNRGTVERGDHKGGQAFGYNRRHI